METTTRPDVTCPKTGELIPLDKMSISKWSEKLYHIWCPACRVWHGFNRRESGPWKNF